MKSFVEKTTFSTKISSEKTKINVLPRLTNLKIDL